MLIILDFFVFSRKVTFLILGNFIHEDYIYFLSTLSSPYLQLMCPLHSLKFMIFFNSCYMNTYTHTHMLTHVCKYSLLTPFVKVAHLELENLSED